MPDASTSMQRFRMAVIADNALQNELRHLDRLAFVTRVIAHASEHGCAVTEAEVEAALNAGFHAWMMRGLDR